MVARCSDEGSDVSGQGGFNGGYTYRNQTLPQKGDEQSQDSPFWMIQNMMQRMVMGMGMGMEKG